MEQKPRPGASTPMSGGLGELDPGHSRPLATPEQSALSPSPSLLHPSHPFPFPVITQSPNTLLPQDLCPGFSSSGTLSPRFLHGWLHRVFTQKFPLGRPLLTVLPQT